VEEHWIKRLYMSLLHIPVTLVETTDYYRLVQLIKNVKLFNKLFKDGIYLLILQTSKLYGVDIPGGKVLLFEEKSNNNGVLGIGGNQVRNVIDDLDSDAKPRIGREMEEEGSRKKPLDKLYIMYSVRDGARVRELSDRVYYWAQTLDKNRLIIFTTDMGMWDDVVRKLCAQIFIPPSTSAERRVIIERITKKYNKRFDMKELNKIIEISSGMDITQLRRIAEASIMKYGSLNYNAFLDEKKKLLMSYNLHLEEPNITFDDIGGYEVIKRYFKYWLNTAITNPSKFEKYGLNPPKGVLLYGPPGTGKTMMARALSNETGLPLIRISGGTFLSKYVGESERTVEKITRLLNYMGRTIVFIDEIDSIALSREQVGTGDTGTFLRVLSSLLSWLSDENRPSIVIGTTNKPYNMDEAFIRYGRFDDLIPMLYPDEEARRKIIEVHLKNRYVSENLKIPINIIRETKYWTGAELKMLVDMATRMALMEDSPINTKHLILAFENIKDKFDEKPRIAELRRYEEFTRRSPNANMEMLKGQLFFD